MKNKLTGKWRLNSGGLFCGTIRIARIDFDTDPAEAFKNEIYDWVTKKLNHIDALPSNPADEKFNLEKFAKDLANEYERARRQEVNKGYSAKQIMSKSLRAIGFNPANKEG